VVVLWPHHVGIITAQAPNGQWLVHSGNDRGAVRTRPRSLRRDRVSPRLSRAGLRFAILA
jgi:hypothetical protein